MTYTFLHKKGIIKNRGRIFIQFPLKISQGKETLNGAHYNLYYCTDLSHQWGIHEHMMSNTIFIAADLETDKIN